ncbi:ECF RNA polymerase sigma-E factor [Gimesia panareensis]|uniref:ECF RNA polymerase sigma-E factor n=1 Tax=Gimesia panareensis TaxID=2527978 RepID=A0A518A1Z0_9PLAN|nr:ECF RNA polymerase sigma-E factor [Gimesia panareensis]QDU48748.1 ECF RNA polymerase sigma-E factor [Gimesia panareensis]QDV18085.1 ECF RNA polymerase sigma-E factor [Gimesia panareensis]
MTNNDQYLIQECLAGRTEAFDQLVLKYQDRLYRTLVRILGSSDDARDAAQEGFTQAFFKLSTFRGTAAFYSWLFRISFNAAITQKRKQKRSATTIDPQENQSGQWLADPHPENHPPEVAERTERKQLVHQALNELQEEYRTPLILRELEGMSYGEIAELTEVPLGTVRSRIFRGRNELKQKLNALFQEEPLARVSESDHESSISESK